MLFSAEYEHRSRLHALSRDFTRDSLDPTQPGYNAAPWSTFTNLAGWQPRGPLPAVPNATANGEFGAPSGGIVSDFTPASCAAVGGRYDNNFTCAYNYIPYYNLVEKNDIYRAYAQLNAQLNDDNRFHLDASYGHVEIAAGVRFARAADGARAGFDDWLDLPVLRAEHEPLCGRVRCSQWHYRRIGFHTVAYRLLAHGGNLAFGNGNGFGVPDKIENKVWRLSTGLNGELGEWAGFARGVGYDLAVTYNHSSSFNTHPDTIGYRLQEALNGFGGSGCQATDLDPARFGTQNPGAAGKNGCLWWNPFSTSFANQPVRDLANPNYVAGDENSAELTRWLFDPRATETDQQQLHRRSRVQRLVRGQALRRRSRAGRSAGRDARSRVTRMCLIRSSTAACPASGRRTSPARTAPAHQTSPSGSIGHYRPEFPRLHARQSGTLRALRAQSARPGEPESVLGIR